MKRIAHFSCSFSINLSGSRRVQGYYYFNYMIGTSEAGSGGNKWPKRTIKKYQRNLFNSIEIALNKNNQIED
jgi:hypothetical protein